MRPDIEVLKAARERGWTYQMIATASGMSVTSIYLRCIKSFEPRGGKRRKFFRGINLAGRQFGRLRAIEPTQFREPGGGTHIIWRCECSCGEKRSICVRSDQLLLGRATSCGCLSTFFKGPADATQQMNAARGESLEWHNTGMGLLFPIDWRRRAKKAHELAAQFKGAPFVRERMLEIAKNYELIAEARAAESIRAAEKDSIGVTVAC
jgi:hypothetical protein